MKKRILSLLMATIMLLSLALPAIAEEGEVYAAEEIAFSEASYSEIPAVEEPEIEMAPAIEAAPAPDEESIENIEPEPGYVEEHTTEQELISEELLGEEILPTEELLSEPEPETDMPVEEPVYEIDLSEEPVTEEIPEKYAQIDSTEYSIMAIENTRGNFDIDATFPDSTFREFVRANYDTNSDGYLDESEISSVTTIFCSNQQIRSFEGIEVFTKLRDFYCYGNNYVSDLDLSGCAALEYLTCNKNGLSNLNVSGCKALKELICSSCNVRSLDISGCTALKKLTCHNNPMMTSLIIGGSATLENIDLDGTVLVRLDVSNCTSLTIISCGSNRLSYLIVTGCTAIKEIYCSSNRLQSLDVSDCTSLETLNCNNNYLESLNVIGCISLTNLYCDGNYLTTLDMSNCAALKNVSCFNNKLTSLNVNGCIALESITCSNTGSWGMISGDNQLIDLDVSSCSTLQTLWCSGIQLESLDLSKNTMLTQLDCDGNQLTSLDISNCTALEYLNCEDNQLTNLDLSKNSMLCSLDCSENQLTSLDISGCPKIKNLYRTGEKTEQNETIKYIDNETRHAFIFDSSVEIICNSNSIDISGTLKEGPTWQLLWKCYGSIAEEPSEDANDLTLEIIMKESAAAGEAITVEGSPWLEDEYGLSKTSFTSIIISGTVSKRLRITQGQFQNYSNVKQVTMDYVYDIAASAFENCEKLESVDGFDETLMYIGDSAFKGCTSLTNILHNHSGKTIYPKKLSSIGSEAFAKTNIQEIYIYLIDYCDSSNDEKLKIGNNAFSECKELTIFCYPYTSAHKYANENSINTQFIVETAFDIGKDSWSFANSWESFSKETNISLQDINRLFPGLLLTEKTLMYREVLGGFQHGLCRGMSASAILSKMGIFSPSDLDKGKQYLYDVKQPKYNTEVASTIEYYHLAQFMCSDVLDRRLYVLNSDETKVAKIETLAEEAMTSGTPFMISLTLGTLGRKIGHCVVGYGIERGNWEIQGTVYDSRVLIYDNCYPLRKNHGTLYNDRDTSLYFNKGTGTWFIPAWPGATRIEQATNDIGVLAPQSSAIREGLKVIYSKDTYKLLYDSISCNITPLTNTNGIVSLSVLNGADSQTQMITTFFADSPEYKIIPSSLACDFMIEVQDALIDVDCANASSITFHPDGSFTAADVSGDYDMSLVFNEGAYNTPWYETNIQGSGNGSISMSQVAEGILIDGANNGTVTVTVTDTQDNASQISYDTNEATVLVTNMTIDGEEVPVVKADKDGDGTFEHLVATGKAAPTVKLDREYMLLHTEEEETLKVSVSPEEVRSYLKWTVENADEETNEEDPVITVDENGKVTALNAGTAFVVATVEIGEKAFSARCRVDVVEDDGTTETPIADAVEETVIGVTLPETKGNVELYRTDYTKIPVLLNLKQNMPQNSVTFATMFMAGPEESSQNNGAAITGAEFTDEDTARMFSLRVVDDRTLEIRPTDDAITKGQNAPKELKASYSSPITVWVEGKEFTTSAYTLTVKKAKPKITATAVKLNSFLADIQPLEFKGETVLEIDEPQDAPGWLTVDTGAKSIIYTGTQKAKQSAKLNLVLTLDGWAIKQQVAVSVSAASTAPKITFKPNTLTVKPETSDSASVTATITPALFAEHNLDFVNIVEGKAEVANGDVISCSVEGRTLTVRANKYPADGKAHTYKVNLSVDGVPGSVTVKTVAKTAPVTMSVKAAGTIDTLIPNSPIVLTPTLKNYNAGGASFSVTKITREKKGEDPAIVTDAFNQTPSGSTIILTAKDLTAIPNGYTYTATVQADLGNGQAVAADTKLTVKSSQKSPAITATLKNSGGIDVIRPESTVIVTPTLKNVYGHVYAEEDLVFYRGTGAKATEITNKEEIPFIIQTDAGGYQLKLKGEIGDLKTDTYSLGMRFTTDNGQAVATKAPVAIPIKMGTAKLAQSTKAVQLLKNDRYSYEEILIWSDDATLSGIKDVKIVDKTNTFAVDYLGNGKVAIHFADNQISTAALKAKSMSIKLDIWLEGNNAAKANGSISLKVNLA